MCLFLGFLLMQNMLLFGRCCIARGFFFVDSDSSLLAFFDFFPTVRKAWCEAPSFAPATALTQVSAKRKKVDFFIATMSRIVSGIEPRHVFVACLGRESRWFLGISFAAEVRKLHFL
jgi:hypothetical protein